MGGTVDMGGMAGGVHGHCDARFARVREVFEKHFADGEEVGASFAVFHRGRVVVDLWGGLADHRAGREWERDTPAFVYSCTKAVTAAAVLLLAEDGVLDLTAPVASVWPEFEARGKAGITVEHLLTHQAGLPVIEDEVPLEEFDDLPAVAARLAGQAPLWTPGAAHGYHALTYGFLLEEVVRRAAGCSVADMVADRIAGPLGLELWLGAPDEVAAHAARLTAGDRANDRVNDRVNDRANDGAGARVDARANAVSADGLLSRALGNPPIHRLKGGANHPLMLRAGWPAAGVVATARGLAGFYRALVEDALLEPSTLVDATGSRVRGHDRVLQVETAFGLGFMLPSAAYPAPPRARRSAFGHLGYGGALGMGDAVHGLGMAYIMNRMSHEVVGNVRAYRLVEAVYDSLP
ncbi:serine hydrolase domain-containing protein [Sinosporangium album]|nr:serine hydrolase domain-containing protein [Sinosporangium album]